MAVALVFAAVCGGGGRPVAGEDKRHAASAEGSREGDENNKEEGEGIIEGCGSLIGPVTGVWDSRQ